MSPGYEKSEEGPRAGVWSLDVKEDLSILLRVRLASLRASCLLPGLSSTARPSTQLSLKTQYYLSLTVMESRALGPYVKLERKGKLLATFLSLC